MTSNRLNEKPIIQRIENKTALMKIFADIDKDREKIAGAVDLLLDKEPTSARLVFKALRDQGAKIGEGLRVIDNIEK